MSANQKSRENLEEDFVFHCILITRTPDTDPSKVYAWLALAHILSAHRQNHSVTYKQAAFKTDLGTYDLWAPAKESAITKARKAMDLLEPDTPAWHFTKCILEKAQALEPMLPKTHSTVSLGGYPVSQIPNPSDAALGAAKITLDEFLDFVRQIPGHEWLTESDIARPKARSSGGCFIATAVLGTPYAEDVIRLRSFRDFFLRQFFWGRVFIKFYETVSPPMANMIARSSFARQITHAILVHPTIRIATYFQCLNRRFIAMAQPNGMHPTPRTKPLMNLEQGAGDAGR